MAEKPYYDWDRFETGKWPDPEPSRPPRKKSGGILEFLVILIVAFALVFGFVRPFVVEAAAGHPWVSDLPPVTSGAVSAYLGVVLTDSPGNIIGSLCVYDAEPRTWDDRDVDVLTAVAEAIADELEDAAAAAA